MLAPTLTHVPPPSRPVCAHRQLHPCHLHNQQCAPSPYHLTAVPLISSSLVQLSAFPLSYVPSSCHPITDSPSRRKRSSPPPPSYPPLQYRSLWHSPRPPISAKLTSHITIPSKALARKSDHISIICQIFPSFFFFATYSHALPLPTTTDSHRHHTTYVAPHPNRCMTPSKPPT